MICPFYAKTAVGEEANQECMSTSSTTPRAPIEPAAFKLPGACQYLGGLSQVTVRRLVEKGLLRPNRAVRHLIFSRAELDRFLAAGDK